MRVLFVVQGEGRGHLTQAISLAQTLQHAGHHIVGAWVNVTASRPLPAFFLEQFTAPVTGLAGPLLVYNAHNNALNLSATLHGILRNINGYRHSLTQLRDAIEEHRPDVVVNFFELLGGLTYGIYQPNVPMVCVGHLMMWLWAVRWEEELTSTFQQDSNPHPPPYQEVSSGFSFSASPVAISAISLASWLVSLGLSGLAMP